MWPDTCLIKFYWNTACSPALSLAVSMLMTADLGCGRDHEAWKANHFEHSDPKRKYLLTLAL